MNCDRRFLQRTVRLIVSRLCLVGVVASLSIAPVSQAGNRRPWLTRPITGQRNGQSGNDKAKKVIPLPPQAGPPVGTLPNLNEAKTRPTAVPRTPQPIPSTLRSRRKARRGQNDKIASWPRQLHHGRPVRADFSIA